MLKLFDACYDHPILQLFLLNCFSQFLVNTNCYCRSRQLQNPAVLQFLFLTNGFGVTQHSAIPKSAPMKTPEMGPCWQVSSFHTSCALGWGCWLPQPCDALPRGFYDADLHKKCSCEAAGFQSNSGAGRADGSKTS